MSTDPDSEVGTKSDPETNSSPMADLDALRKYKQEMAIVSTCIQSLNRIVNRRRGSEGVGIEDSVSVLMFIEMMRALTGIAVNFSKSYVEVNGDVFLEPGVDPDVAEIANEVINKTRSSIDEFDHNFENLMNQFQRHLMHIIHSRVPPGM